MQVTIKVTVLPVLKAFSKRMQSWPRRETQLVGSQRSDLCCLLFTQGGIRAEGACFCVGQSRGLACSKLLGLNKTNMDI